jgi:hypothetical protein
MCLAHIYSCGDGVDNDGDGLVDSDDPECTGACDNDEDHLGTSIPGQPGAPCLVDCAFDLDSGSGNDDCFWNHRCDPFEAPPGYYPDTTAGPACAYDPAATTAGTLATCAELATTQSAACKDTCGRLTPNGCDCFGCCELPSGSGNFVWLDSMSIDFELSCSVADALDPAKCHPCTPVPGCLNPCDPCEICLGKPSLPMACAEQDCAGRQACGLPGQACCTEDTYCVTGCCQPLLQ